MQIIKQSMSSSPKKAISKYECLTFKCSNSSRSIIMDWTIILLSESLNCHNSRVMLYATAFYFSETLTGFSPHYTSVMIKKSSPGSPCLTISCPSSNCTASRASATVKRSHLSRFSEKWWMKELVYNTNFMNSLLFYFITIKREENRDKRETQTITIILIMQVTSVSLSLLIWRWTARLLVGRRNASNAINIEDSWWQCCSLEYCGKEIIIYKNLYITLLKICLCTHPKLKLWTKIPHTFSFCVWCFPEKIIKVNEASGDVTIIWPTSMYTTEGNCYLIN